MELLLIWGIDGFGLMIPAVIHNITIISRRKTGYDTLRPIVAGVCVACLR